MVSGRGVSDGAGEREPGSAQMRGKRCRPSTVADLAYGTVEDSLP